MALGGIARRDRCAIRLAKGDRIHELFQPAREQVVSEKSDRRRDSRHGGAIAAVGGAL